MMLGFPIARSDRRTWTLHEARLPLAAHRIAVAASAALASALAGCSQGDHDAQAKSLAAPGRSGPLQPPVGAYRVVPVVGAGSVRGTVEMDGDPIADSSVATAGDATAECGATVRVPGVRAAGGRVGGVVVWLTDARAGKPLPVEKRYELLHASCLLDPVVQGAVVGGTLNVHGADALVQRTRFTRLGTPAESLSVVTMDDAGQVVPDERVLRQAGTVEATSEPMPWMRAWLLVFDHPYFATSAADGGFALDSVPPGTYHVEAWHPRGGHASATVVVGTGGEAPVRLKLERR